MNEIPTISYSIVKDIWNFIKYFLLPKIEVHNVEAIISQKNFRLETVNCSFTIRNLTHKTQSIYDIHLKILLKGNDNLNIYYPIDKTKQSVNINPGNSLSIIVDFRPTMNIRDVQGNKEKINLDYQLFIGFKHRNKNSIYYSCKQTDSFKRSWISI